MVEFTEREELQAWLEKQPREVSVVIAARAALRVAPVFEELVAVDQIRKNAENIILPCFRCTAVSWAAPRYPAQDTDLIAAATYAAARTAARAATTAATTTAAATTARAAATATYAAATYAAARTAARAATTAATTTAAATTAAAEIWQAVSRDATEIEDGMAAHELAAKELWSDGTPKELAIRWEQLKTALLALDEDWQVWTDWHEDRLYGRPAIEALEIARITEITEEEWEAGPKVVNAHIRRLIAKHTHISQKPLSYGHTFLLEGAQFEIAEEGDAEDLKIARQTTTRQQHQQLKERLQAFSQIAQRANERHGWEDLQPIVQKVVTAIGQNTESVAREITVLWDLLVDLASFLEMNEDLQISQRSTNISPLDPNERRALSALVTSLSAFVRDFPTGRKRDDDSGAFRVREALLDPARRLFEGAGERALLSEADRDLLIGLLEAAKRGDFQGGKAATASVGSARNLIMKGASVLVAFYLGGAASIASSESIVMQSIARLFIDRESAIFEIVKDMPAGYEQAIRNLIRDLGENPQPKQIPAPQVGLTGGKRRRKPES